MLDIKELAKYYKGKKVLVTGHTGFKGAYVLVLLKYLGAKVYGYALKEEKNSLYSLMKKECDLVNKEVYADIRDYEKLKKFVKEYKPDYILHMAAQPLVLTGYNMPRYTYDVNVMGTVNLMEAIREIYGNAKNLVSILNVTTDKVYENNDLSNYAFIESDKLGGLDPYANSKSCSELVTFSYLKSFFQDKKIFRVSTARAGNVIGGGDMSDNRIIPDCYRAIKKSKDMVLRNPHAIRPYQFVYEPLILYLNIMAYQKMDAKYEGNYNIGPDKRDCLANYEIVNRFYKAFGEEYKNDGSSIKSEIKILDKNIAKKAKHEAAFLRLDNSKVKKVLNYKEIFTMEDCMKHTAKIYYNIMKKENIVADIINIVRNVNIKK